MLTKTDKPNLKLTSENGSASNRQDHGGIELIWNSKKVVLGLLKKTLPRTLKKVDELCFGDKKSNNFIKIICLIQK